MLSLRCRSVTLAARVELRPERARSFRSDGQSSEPRLRWYTPGGIRAGISADFDDSLGRCTQLLSTSSWPVNRQDCPWPIWEAAGAYYIGISWRAPPYPARNCHKHPHFEWQCDSPCRFRSPHVPDTSRFSRSVGGPAAIRNQCTQFLMLSRKLTSKIEYMPAPAGLIRHHRSYTS